MVNCSHCSSANVDGANYCFACGRRLETVAASPATIHERERDRLHFLLTEMSRWVQHGLLSPSACEVISRSYRVRMQTLDQQAQAVELRELGARSERQQHFGEALVAYSRALELAPNDVELSVTVRRLQEVAQPEVEHELAAATKLFNAGAFADSEAQCSKFIESPTNADRLRLAAAYDLRAQARERLGRVAAALTDAERAKQLAPNTVEYAVRVARLWRATQAQQRVETPEAAPTPPVEPVRPARDLARVVEAFCEERNIFWWHLVSALLLVSGLVGLAWWQWSLLGGYVLTASVLATTMGLYHFGKSIHGKLPDTGRVLIVLSMIIAPLNVVIVKSHLGFRFDWNVVGLLTSVASCALYVAALRRWQFESLSYLVGAAALSAVHHALRSCDVQWELEGLYFVPVALAMLVVSHRMRDGETPVTKPFSVLAQVVVAFSLLSTLMSPSLFFTGASKLHGVFLMLMSAVFCAAFSDLFKQSGATYVASIFVGLGALLFAMEFRIPLEQSAALAGLGVAVVLTTAARVYEETRHDDELARDISSGYFVCGVTSSIGVVLVLLLQGVGWLTHGGLPGDPASLGRTLATVAMSAGFYAALARLYRKPFCTHVALGLASYAWFLASRWLALALGKPPINVGLALYPMTLILALFGTQQVRRARALASANASHVLIPLMWAGVLAALSLGVQIFEQGVSVAVIASRLGQVAEFLRFRGSGGVSGIATFILHAALFAFFAHEFGHGGLETEGASGGEGERETARATTTTRATTTATTARATTTATTATTTGGEGERENGSNGSSVLQRVAFVGAPWLATATVACAIIAVVQSLTMLHLAPAAGMLTMLAVAAGMLALGVIAERARQPWWSRPLSASAFVVSLVFAFVPFLKPSSDEAWLTIGVMSSAVLLWSVMSVRPLFHRDESKEEDKPVAPPAGASPLFIWIAMALETTLAVLFIAAIPFTGLILGSWHLTVYFTVCAACWITLGFHWKSTPVFIAGLVATTAATVEFVCVQLPIGQTRVGAYGLASIGYAFALLACGCVLRHRANSAFASCVDAFAQAMSLAGLVMAVIAYQQVSAFRLPVPGTIDLVAIDRWLLVVVGAACALLFAMVYRSSRDPWLLRVASLCGTAAYAGLIEFPFALPGWLVSLNNEANFGLAFLPLVAVAMSLAALLQGRKSPAVTTMIEAATVIIVCCIAAQPYYIYAAGHTFTPVLTLLSAACLGVVGAACTRCAWLVYPTSALAGWGVTQWLSNAGCDASQLAVVVAVFGGVMFVASEFLSRERSEEWREVFANSAAAFAVGANCFAAQWIAASAAVSAGAGVLATMLLGALAVRRRSTLMADLGAGSLAAVCVSRMIWGGSGWWMATATISPVITALPAIVGAYVLLAVAFMLERERPAVFSVLSLSAAWMTFAIAGFPKVASLTMFPVLAMCGVGYGLFAHQRKSMLFGAIGAVAIAIAHSHGLACLPIPTRYFPLLFAPVVVALAIWPEEMPHLCKPFRATAGIVSVVALLHASTVGDRSIMLAALLLYGALYFADAVRRQSQWQAVVACSLLSGAWAHCLHGFGLSSLQFLLYFSPLSLGWLAVAVYFASDEKAEQLVPVFVAYSALIAGGVSALAVIGVGADRPNGTYAVFALLVASLTFGLLCAFQKLAAWGHGSFFCVLLAYYLPLFDKHIQAPDAYLIPIGVYLIALSLIQEGASAGSKLSQPFGSAQGGPAKPPSSLGCDLGLFVVLASSLWGSLTMSQNPWHDVVLTTDALLAFAFGLAQRRKTFSVQGTGALAILGLIKSWGILVSIHWAIYATMLGLGGLAAGYYFSLKRVELLKLSQRMREELAAWR